MGLPKSGANRRKHGLQRKLLLAAVVIGLSSKAGAQGVDSGWQFELTPYLWGSAMSGTVKSGALPPTRVDMSFYDIVDILDFGAMGTLEARKGKWGLLFDALYVQVSDSGTTTRTGPGPLGASLTARAHLTFEQTMLAAALAYRVAEGRTPLDVVGGLRYTKIDVEADIEASLFGQTGYQTRGGNENWVDPYIGLRAHHALSDRWTLTGYADIGGFGVGSDFAWQAIAGLVYQHSKAVSIKFGYRVLDVDYDRSGFRYDIKTDGLYLGAGLRF